MPKHYGGIDTITPGHIGGWVYSDDALLTEVRLLVGPNLLAQASINQHRRDVCQKLGVEGVFGFNLELSGDLPAVAFEDAPRVLALSVDGGASVDLFYQPEPTKTVEQLRQALAPQVRGSIGHFDGLSPDGDALLGWGYRRGQGSGQPIVVWLQTEGQPPVELLCDRYRPGMSAQGHPEQCGFEIELHQLPPSWAGQEVQVFFDFGGVMSLPGAGSVRIPGSGQGMIMTPAQLMHPSSASPYASQIANAPSDLQQSWQALEQFRQFLDGMEHQVCRAEALQQQVRTGKVLEATRRLRKRDRFLRFLGLGR
jgi:hypothetical protein